MIISDKLFKEQSSLYRNPHRVLYVTLMITSDILENAKLSITSYEIHFLTPQRVSNRLTLKPMITLFSP